MRVPLSWLREFVDLPDDVTPEAVLADLVRVGFEEEDVDVRVFGQSVRHCESGWSAADDNVVVRCQ